ncbi:hypothetical protein SLUN_02975 [Streptomyces lunaelactis]|uniref:Uncharacterized protein n=1 Tax=Streptomyces lunaelactis TaxID=1535768 RepID=A0A2R4SWT2_9ACTN|nr:DUF5999 family protein [Streptomyces lunaelactis]AVZ71343.1 hypothetical protein SLUN_02975 [Streptomyces lunaelactis]
MRSNRPPCPSAASLDRAAAHTFVPLPEQGWSPLCNAAILFEDMGELLPDGRAESPLPSTGQRACAAA